MVRMCIKEYKWEKKIGVILSILARPRKSYWKGSLSTIDLLVLTSLYQLLFVLKMFFTVFTKLGTLMRRSTVLSPPSLLAFRGQTIQSKKGQEGMSWPYGQTRCRCLQKYVLNWKYYVCCLWAPLLVLTQSKETVSWSNLVFFTIKARFWQYYS